MADLISMLSAASGATAEADPDFNSTVLLLHGDGTNGAQNNTFLDSSTNNFTITRNGNTTQGTFSPFSRSSGNLVNAPYDPAVHGGSGYFDGSGDYLITQSNSALGLGTGDFTIECWAYFNGVSTQQNFIDARTTGVATAPILYITATGVVNYSAGAAALISSSSNAVSATTWTHIALARSGGNSKLFVNGVQVGTTAADTTNFGTTAFTLGAVDNGTNPMTGYLSDVRVVKGTAVYTSAFTPPTAPLTAITNTSLLCNFTNAGIIDNTGKNNLETVGNAQIDTTTKKYGTGSLEFDGTGDYLDSPSIENVQFGTGDFTIEGWLYINSLAAAQVLFEFRAVNGASYGQVYITTGGVLRFYLPTDYGTSNTFTTSTWTHFAIARSAGTLKMFIGGVEGFSGSYTSAMDATRFRIGADTAGGSGFNGFIDDLRITKGVARYTAAFTPPTKAFPDQ
jgi:hypothetical protein